ncbi:MAG: hypothetical protein H6601_08935 [Flavobacteriales bacterium]|nr:hypothetical protein [Flavobacteriales bacterium]
MNSKRRTYTKPQAKKVTIDNEISMVMMSYGPVGGDPEGSLRKFNPLKWWK